MTANVVEQQTRRPFVERSFVWLGGAAFVASLTYCAYAYATNWAVPQPFSWPEARRAAAMNGLAFLAFAAHHSLFARAGVKAWLARSVPDRLIRAVYVWAASALLVVLVAFWRPIGGQLYSHTGFLAAVHALVQLVGLGLIAASVRAIDALELAGIRPGQSTGGLQFGGPYGLVRHPLYLGWVLTVFGAARMTGDRLAFATLTTVYLLMAIPWEERSLERAFGGEYQRYKRQVRWRIVPFVY